MIGVNSPAPRAGDDRGMRPPAATSAARIAWIAASLAACAREPPPTPDYYERTIQPILTTGCAFGTSPCHRDDGTGRAMGNLDVGSYERLTLRADLLRQYGSYPDPLLLVKATASRDLAAPYRDTYAPLDIPHGGGAVLQVSSAAYRTLAEWLAKGATRSGIPPVDDGATTGTGPCATRIPAGIDVALVDPAEPGFAAFPPVQDFLVATCAAGSCHGSPQADLQFTCGDDDAQTRANYLMARAYVAPVAEDSELLVRPLSPSEGGMSHAGGALFPSRDHADYVLVRDWAAQAGPLPDVPAGPARRFFDDQVMPILLRRGCAMPACHGPMIAQGLKLRAGSFGFFSPIALAKNYQEARGFLSLSSPDPRVSRLVAKNLFPADGGIRHRAGPLLLSPGAPRDPRDCPTPWDAATATPLCTVAEWLRLERAELPPPHGAPFTGAATVPLVWIERPPDAARFVDFAAYRPGADLLRGEASLDARGAITQLAGRVSLLAGCPGVGAGRDDIDVRAPEPSPGGDRLLFAMRIGEAGGLDVYEIGLDGSACRRLTTDGGAIVNGIRADNFDPAWVVDEDGTEWVVYASTRGGPDGPTRTPKLFLPNSDLWRQPVAGGPAERMTFLRGVEAQPAVMNDGHLTLVVEKASADFYQIAGRRLNWDLTDYHPLLGQRREGYSGHGGYLPGEAPAGAELVQSIGYGQVSEIRQGLNGDFLVVLADAGVSGEGGALGLFNRSVGPFQAGLDDPGFLPSLEILSGPTGRAGEAAGAYRSPFPLPDGSILASWAGGIDVGAGAPIQYDLVIVDRPSGARSVLLAGPLAEVEAALAWPRVPPAPFRHEPSDAAPAPGEAIVHFPDLPLLATLLDTNDRHGRDVDALRAATRVRFFAQASPPASCDTPVAPECAGDLAGDEQVYEAVEELGAADLAADGSAWLRLPAARPMFLELLDGDGVVLFRAREETQFGPGEVIGMGVPPRAYDSLCAVCHGSVSGRELDIHLDVDAVTRASETQARPPGPVPLSP